MEFTTSEIILLIFIVSVILVIFVILTIIDIKDYLRTKKKVVLKTNNNEEEKVINVLDYSQDIKEVNNEKIKEKEEEKENNNYVINKKNVEIIEVNDHKPILEEGEVIFEKEDLNPDPFYEEEDVVVPVKDEIIYKEAMTQKEAKEEILKVQEKLQEEKHDSLADTITNFEMEQEENAIISLDELMKVSNKLYEDNEPIQYDDGDEPITIDEVIRKYNNVKNDAKDAKVSVVEANDAIKDNVSDMYIEEDDDFLTDLEIAHENLHR